MRIHPYPSFVKRVSMCPKKKKIAHLEVRYSLKIKVSNNYKGKSASVIMMNPSQAKAPIQKGSDLSVNRVIKELINNPNIDSKVEHIYILNLLPFYGTDPAQLAVTLSNLKNYDQLRVSNHLKRNIKCMKILLEKADYIILAWGDPPKTLHHSLIEKQKTFILSTLVSKDNIYVFKSNSYTPLLTDYNNPRHPSRIEITGLQQIKINHLLMMK